MIIRIVKMSFSTENVSKFEALFDARKEHIRRQPGCLHLELWKEKTAGNIYFTYSYWQQEADLENYRHSSFFLDTWTKTKALFDAKAEAWSVEQRQVLP